MGNKGEQMKYEINGDGSVSITKKDYYKIHKDYRITRKLWMNTLAHFMLVLNPKTQATELRLVKFKEV
jgi:hypothetical protein